MNIRLYRRNRLIEVDAPIAFAGDPACRYNAAELDAAALVEFDLDVDGDVNTYRGDIFSFSDDHVTVDVDGVISCDGVVLDVPHDRISNIITINAGAYT
jgi:hypothetical protein